MQGEPPLNPQPPIAPPIAAARATISVPPALLTQGSLSPAQMQEYRDAQKRSRKVKRAVSVAVADAWITSIFATLGLVFLLFSFSLLNLLFGIGMALVAVNSLRGARRLKRLDPTAPMLLALNQLLLTAIIIAYCIYQVVAASRAPVDPELQQALAQLGADASSLAQMEQQFILVIYWGVAAGTLLLQGLTALYYLTRRRYIDDYLAATPEWILQVQKAEAGA